MNILLRSSTTTTTKRLQTAEDSGLPIRLTGGRLRSGLDASRLTALAHSAAAAGATSTRSTARWHAGPATLTARMTAGRRSQTAVTDTICDVRRLLNVAVVAVVVGRHGARTTRCSANGSRSPRDQPKLPNAPPIAF